MVEGNAIDDYIKETLYTKAIKNYKGNNSISICT